MYLCICKTNKKANSMSKIIGTTEDRLNRFMSMCLAWQRDLRTGTYHPAAYYFTNYHIGKYRVALLGDLKNSVIDREWAIDKMNDISLACAKKSIDNGLKAQSRPIYTDANVKETSVKQLELFDKEGNPNQSQSNTKDNESIKVNKVQIEKPSVTKAKTDKKEDNNEEKASRLVMELLSMGYDITIGKK